MSEYINENADIFDDEKKKHNLFIAFFKWLGIAIILLVVAILFYRCMTHKDHPIVEKVLMNESFYEAYEAEPDMLFVRQYGMPSPWVSIDEGRLIEFNYLYHIPKTRQLQFSIKYNNDIIPQNHEGFPFKLKLVDENGNEFFDFWYERASRERYRYIRVCFEDIDLETGIVDENGKSTRHSYTLYIESPDEKGNFSELCSYSLFNGLSDKTAVFKNKPYKVLREK